MPSHLTLVSPEHEDALLKAELPDQHEIHQEIRDRQREYSGSGSAAGILPIMGLIHPGYLAVLAALFRAMLDDRSVSRIILLTDSGGGYYAGVPEFASIVFNARGRKPIDAYVGGFGVAASAGYWIPAAADRIIVTPSAYGLGSIGAVSVHMSIARALKDGGADVTFFRNPSGKARGSMLEQLDEATKEKWQSDIDSIAGEFIRTMGRYRKGKLTSIAARNTDARTFNARDALSLGLIDRVATWEEYSEEVFADADRRIQERSFHPRIRLAMMRKDGRVAPGAPDRSAIERRADKYAEKN